VRDCIPQKLHMHMKWKIPRNQFHTTKAGGVSMNEQIEYILIQLRGEIEDRNFDNCISYLEHLEEALKQESIIQ